MIDMSLEADRLETLLEYEILDTPPEPQFDAIVEAAAQRTQAPIAMITLVEDDRQWFKARTGMEAEETPIEQSFCAHAIQGDELFVVPDATADSRFHDYANVTGEPNIRFYAGAPLRMDNGVCIGTLCVIDVEPRAGLDPEEQAALQDLARRTVAAFEMRREMRRHRAARVDALLAGAAAASQHLPQLQPQHLPWLERATSHLLQAAAALEQIDAGIALAHLEETIDQVDRLRFPRR